MKKEYEEPYAVVAWLEEDVVRCSTVEDNGDTGSWVDPFA